MIKKIIIIVLSTIFISCSNSYISKENEKKFSVNEVEEIDKIFLSDRNGNNITLSKKENYWQVNEKYRVRPDAIKTLLSTVQQISVQSPVSESSYNNVIKQLATTGVKVEIYYNNSVKTYTVGGSTNNHLGTYMLMDNAEYPYILHILGFNGFLAPRYGIQGYKLNINNWRDNKVFKINSEEIKKLSLYDYNKNKNSFTINCQPISLINNESIKIKYNINEVIKYLNHFSDLGCEDFKGYDIDLTSEKLLYKLIINYNNKEDVLKAYTFSKKNMNSNNSKPNVERMYATLNDGEVMLIQNYVFNKVFISIDELKE
ncbi:MAG: DUF4340 domain-containing protein [Flavobacteriales bacterium]|jgi:hypothetical protein|nr:DUF4340 domain-containing protein [Flavobacteriales bacterium]